MRARLQKLWQARAPRERVVIAVLAATIAVLFYLWLLQSGGRARLQLGASVVALQAQAARLDRDAEELLRLRALPPTPAAQGDLRSLVQAQLGAAGLSRALLKIDAPDANQVQVALGAVAFAEWLAWVASLQVQHVRLDACRLEALSTPGLVSVTATLIRVRPQ
jgi:type II secretory pathway component PulM